MAECCGGGGTQERKSRHSEEGGGDTTAGAQRVHCASGCSSSACQQPPSRPAAAFARRKARAGRSRRGKKELGGAKSVLCVAASPATQRTCPLAVGGALAQLVCELTAAAAAQAQPSQGRPSACLRLRADHVGRACGWLIQASKEGGDKCVHDSCPTGEVPRRCESAVRNQRVSVRVCAGRRQKAHCYVRARATKDARPGNIPLPANVAFLYLSYPSTRAAIVQSTSDSLPSFSSFANLQLCNCEAAGEIRIATKVAKGDDADIRWRCSDESLPPPLRPEATLSRNLRQTNKLLPPAPRRQLQLCQRFLVPIAINNMRSTCGLFSA